jgi:hypothetical protein
MYVQFRITVIKIIGKQRNNKPVSSGEYGVGRLKTSRQ